jgi:hypothetical protein
MMAAKRQVDLETARKARAEEQRRLEDKAFRGFILEETEEGIEILKKKRKDWLELQLLWHRRRAQEARIPFPAKSTLRNNTQCAEKLVQCIQARKAAKNTARSEENALGTLQNVPDYVFASTEDSDELLGDEDGDLDAEFESEDEDEELL